MYRNGRAENGRFEAQRWDHLCGLFMTDGWSRSRKCFVDQDHDHLARAVMMSFILCPVNDASIGA